MEKATRERAILSVRLGIIGLGCTLALAFPAAGAIARTVEHRLANGLRIIVKEDRRAPTVVHQVWYRVGSIDEQAGTTGVAHALEHMMFKGTPRFGPGEFSRLIAEAGGRENAFTDRGTTVYFQQVHRSALALAMELEADRMANLLLAEQEFAKEIRVVMEERRLRTEDDPRSLVEENLMATAFSAHSHGWPIIGWMSDLQNMSVADLRAWHRQWYAPNNAVVIVVGDVDPEKTVQLARRYYGKIGSKVLPRRKPLIQPPQRGPRRVNVKAPADQGYVLMGYKVPTMADAEREWEPYALEVLAAVLAGHDSARLNQTLVRDTRVAHSVSVWYESVSRAPGMLILEGVPAGDAAVLERSLREQMARLAADPVPADELDRAKAHVVAREVYNSDSLFRQAMEMGQFEIAGMSWREAERTPERLRSVTAEQLREVAARYFSDDRLTVAVLEPQPIDRRAPRAAPAKGEGK
jgi:zinc protease